MIRYKRLHLDWHVRWQVFEPAVAVWCQICLGWIGVFPIMEALVEACSCLLNFDIDLSWIPEVLFDNLKL